jgi:hypothetical protein
MGQFRWIQLDLTSILCFEGEPVAMGLFARIEAEFHRFCPSRATPKRGARANNCRKN